MPFTQIHKIFIQTVQRISGYRSLSGIQGNAIKKDAAGIIITQTNKCTQLY